MTVLIMLVVVVCCTDSAGNQLGGKQVRGVERTSPHSLFGSEKLKYKIPSFFLHCETKKFLLLIF